MLEYHQQVLRNLHSRCFVKSLYDRDTTSRKFVI